jgi:hypothetical protein
MNLIHLYYITGILVLLLTLVLSVWSVISMEDLFVLALAGIILLALGIVQHMLSLHEKYR